MNSFYLCLFVFSSLSTIAQAQKDYEFLGALELPDKSSITYKLNFTELADGKIEGFSVTDFGGDHRTKSKITGVLNLKAKTISFVETENVITKSDAEAGNFCYVHVENAKIKTGSGKSGISGTFMGKFPDGKSCISGNINLMGSDFIFKKLDKNISRMEKMKIIDSTKSAELSSSTVRKKLDETQLGSGNELKINWTADQIILELWDAETVDQDVISIYVNGKGFLQEYQVQKQKKILTIPFENEECTIKILAESEGRTPPNTTHVMLLDEKNAVPIVTNLKVGEEALIILQKGN